jgi:dihydrofolate reductase
MRNGTTFHFVDATPREVLDMAMRAAEGQDVALGGGPATIQAFLNAGLVDEMHIAIAPVLLGDGERLFEHLRVDVNGYSCSELTCFAGIAHAQLSRTPPESDE